MSSIRFHRAFALCVGFAAIAHTGCPGLGSLEGGVPETPTWPVHVKPILDMYCNECHSDPAQQMAPATIRLDVCENPEGALGAQSQAQRIIVRTIDLVPTPMPPSTYSRQPTPDDKAVLARWVMQGASCEDNPVPVNNGTNNTMNNATIPANNGAMDMGTPEQDVGTDAGSDAGSDVWVFAEVATFMRAKCGISGCHGEPEGQGNLEIPPGVSDADLAATLMTSATGGLPFVSSFEPENSAIYVMMTADAGFMPPTGKLPADAARIRAWIEAGADFGN